MPRHFVVEVGADKTPHQQQHRDQPIRVVEEIPHHRDARVHLAGVQPQPAIALHGVVETAFVEFDHLSGEDPRVYADTHLCRHAPQHECSEHRRPRDQDDRRRRPLPAQTEANGQADRRKTQQDQHPGHGPADRAPDGDRHHGGQGGHAQPVADHQDGERNRTQEVCREADQGNIVCGQGQDRHQRRQDGPFGQTADRDGSSHRSSTTGPGNQDTKGPSEPILGRRRLPGPLVPWSLGSCYSAV